MASPHLGRTVAPLVAGGLLVAVLAGTFLVLGALQSPRTEGPAAQVAQPDPAAPVVDPTAEVGRAAPRVEAEQPVRQQVERPLPHKRVELVAALPLQGGIHADVWGHKGFAYVGTWSAACPGTGVKVIEVADPTQPRLVTTLAAHPGTSAEDVVVISAATQAFTGDLLAVGLQVCGSGGQGGVEFWEVTSPAAPRRLGFLATTGTPGVHELHLFQRDQRVFALLAVPHSERAQAGGDFRIVEATDPRRPRQLADWGAFRDLQLSPSEARGQYGDIFAHSASVSRDGKTAYVAYWDAGLVLLDISDPSSPRLVGRASYSGDDEGNAHSSSASPDGRLVVLADENIEVAVRGLRIDAPAGPAGGYQAVEASFTRPLPQTGPISEELVYVGRACPSGVPPAGATPADVLLADPRGKIALVDRGECHFSTKFARLQQAGAIAAIVGNNVDGPPIRMGAADAQGVITIPGVMIGRGDAQRFREALGNGPLQATLAGDLVVGYNDWGFLRLFDVRNPESPVQIATFATPNARTDRQAGPPDAGHYSVHNPLVVGNLLYASWFSDGLRVLDISDPTRPREIASFVPPPHPDPTGRGFNPDRAMVWGVFVQDDLVLLSDMNFGLYIVRLVDA